jgi:hypothetical protein
VLVWLIPLLACHVFETVAIDCVAGEPCAIADTDADADADADTDDDTLDDGPPIVPAKGFVVSLKGDDGSALVAAYDAAGTLLDEIDAPGAGPVAYRAQSGTTILGVDTFAYKLQDGAEDGVDLGLSVVDVDITADHAWIATGDQVYAVGLDSGEATPTFASDPGTISAIGLGGSEILATVVAEGQVDLFDVTAGLALEKSLGFDSTGARARGVFAGPDGEAFTCSNAGAVYRVADLEAGTFTPTVFYGGDLADVTECAWDPGDGTWLLVSSTGGVIRMDAQGRGTTLYTAPDEYTLVRGNFH